MSVLMTETELICANCKYNTKDDENYYCNNEDSDCYGLPTMYDDSCEDFEEKEINYDY